MSGQIIPSIAAKLDAWQAQGLTVKELSEQDLTQTITVRHNPLTGKLEATYTRLDAPQALGLLVDCLYTIWKDGFQGDLRPALNSGHGKVCIELDGNRLLMAFGTDTGAGQPIADPVIAKGMMLAALFGLCATEGEFDPMQALLSQIEVPTRSQGVD